MASFLIMVHSGRYANQSSRSALKYAEAVVAAGHELKGIFFYSEGVTHANGLTVIPTDELDTAKGFKALNQQHNIPLLICVTAAEKRGILNQEQAQIESLAHHNLDPHYTSAGLAEMAALAGESDKVVQFK